MRQHDCRPRASCSHDLPRLPGFQLALVLLNRPASAEETLREALTVLTTLLALSASVRVAADGRTDPEATIRIHDYADVSLQAIRPQSVW